jgi:hypothetical protein
VQELRGYGQACFPYSEASVQAVAAAITRLIILPHIDRYATAVYMNRNPLPDIHSPILLSIHHDPWLLRNRERGMYTDTLY